MKRNKRKTKSKKEKIHSLKAKLKALRTSSYPHTQAEIRLFKKAVFATRMLFMKNGKWLCPKCGEITTGSLCSGGIPLPICTKCVSEENKRQIDCDQYCNQCRFEWHSGLTGHGHDLEYIQIH